MYRNVLLRLVSNKVNNYVDFLNCRLQHIGSFGTRRLQALKDTGVRNVFEAYQWVQDHRSEFQMEVYGPVLLEVTLVFVNIINKNCYVAVHFLIE